MQQFVETMKEIALNAVENTKPMQIRQGKVLSASPLQVRLSQKEILTKEFLVALYGHDSFQTGDTLILLRFQGGQQYLILGKKGAL